jgi:predicted RNase H-like HicB family nuclease
MKQHFTASIRREGDWYIAQCLEVDVASQGETEDQALSNLREVLELYFEPPTPIERPHIRSLEVEIGGS